MKTIVLLSKTYTFRSPGLFFGCPKSYILDHWEFMKAIVLLIHGSKARKSLNQASWDWFCRLLEPWPESHQIEPLGIGFVDFLSQCWKVIKSSLLGFVLSHRFTIPAQYYIRRTFDYRIIVHWVTCSWVPCLLTEPLGDPQKNCVYAKIISIILCPPPLSHPTLYWYLQSRHSTKCNVLML